MNLRKSSTDRLEQIYRLYEQKMYYLAFSILKDAGLSEDVVHDSILKIMNYLPGIKKVDSPQCRSLVMKITKTTAIDRYRTLHKELTSFEELDEEHLLVEENELEDFLDGINASRLIQQCVEEMPDSLKEIVKLKYYCQLSNQEIAQILEVSMDVVRKRDERLKRFIKEKAGDNYEP